MRPKAFSLYRISKSPFSIRQIRKNPTKFLALNISTNYVDYSEKNFLKVSQANALDLLGGSFEFIRSSSTIELIAIFTKTLENVFSGFAATSWKEVECLRFHNSETRAERLTECYCFNRLEIYVKWECALF